MVQAHSQDNKIINYMPIEKMNGKGVHYIKPTDVESFGDVGELV